MILAGGADAGDVIVLPGTPDAVVVKQIRLGHGGFTVAPAADDRPDAQRPVTLTAGIRLRKTSA
jgi:hypothetical protein